MKAWTTLLAGLLVLSLAACSSKASHNPTASPSPATPSPTVQTPTSLIATPTISSSGTVAPGAGQQTTWTVPSSPDAMTTVAVLTAMRMGIHPEEGGWERIVFEFAGPERPKTTVEYVGQATSCASGQPVTVPGTAILQVAFVGADAHNSAGEATVPRAITGPGSVIKQGDLSCDYEAHVTWDFGLAGKHNFKVSTLANPTRVVIDVKQ